MKYTHIYVLLFYKYTGYPNTDVRANISQLIEVTKKFNKRNLHGYGSAIKSK